MSNNLPPTPWKNDDWSDATLQQMVEHMAQYLPDDWVIEAGFENGAFGVLINDFDGNLHAVDDLIDEPATATAAEQLKWAFEFAMKHGAPEAS